MPKSIYADRGEEASDDADKRPSVNMINKRSEGYVWNGDTHQKTAARFSAIIKKFLGSKFYDNTQDTWGETTWGVRVQAFYKSENHGIGLRKTAPERRDECRAKPSPDTGEFANKGKVKNFSWGPALVPVEVGMKVQGGKDQWWWTLPGKGKKGATCR